MNFRQLRYFLTVAEERHFGRAAARLHISQPPLSQQIKALEESLGCPLFARTTRHVELTEAGEALADRARTLLDGLDAAARETQRVHRGEAGQLALSFVGSATYELLPKLVRALRAELPAVRLVIESERLSPDQEEALLNGQDDLALLSLPDAQSSSKLLEIEVVRSVPLVVALSKEHPLARARSIRLEALEKERFLMHPARGSVLHRKVRNLCHQAGFQPEIAQEVRETVTAVSLAAGGLGVALLPSSVQALRVQGAVYRPLVAQDAHMLQAIATRRGDRSPLLERALEITRAVSRRS